MNSKKDFFYVKSFEDIKATLDSKNSLDGLRFMPEMIKFCGKKFEVEKKMRRVAIEFNMLGYLKDTIMLKGISCDGKYHGNCSRKCQILWKKEWLDKNKVDNNDPEKHVGDFVKSYTTEPIMCQSSTLKNATQFIPLSTLGSLVDKNYLNNASFFDVFRDLLYGLRFIWNPMDWVVLGEKRRTPTESLGLMVGDVVEVKSLDEIKDTLSRFGKNRGLGFQKEMVKYCGKRYRVSNIVKYAISEEDGKYREVKNSVILEGVNCDGSYHKRCERSCPQIWREIWLKKVN